MKNWQVVALVAGGVVAVALLYRYRPAGPEAKTEEPAPAASSREPVKPAGKKKAKAVPAQFRGWLATWAAMTTEERRAYLAKKKAARNG